MNKSNEEASNAVKNYLKSTNRPYSSNDIFNNLQNKFSKSVIVKSLDTLVESKDVCERINGKQKIYFFSQDNFEIDNKSLKNMDDQIERYNSEINQLKESIMTKEQKIKICEEYISLEQLEEQHRALSEVVTQMKVKQKSINAKFKNIDPEVHSKIKNDHKILTTEWKNRKRLASQVFDMILENYPKSKKVFFEEVGIETDEDVNAVLPI